MIKLDRRKFLAGGMAASFAAALPRAAVADPFGLPVGLQLYSVKDLLAKDYDGTLRQIAAIGYGEVELAFPERPAPALRASIASAGLACPSVHYRLLNVMQRTSQVLADVHALGAKYLIVPGPELRDPSRIRSTGDMFKDYGAFKEALTLDDWRWSADQLNRLGEQARREGLSLGYHNHNLDFKRFGDVSGFDALVAATDAALVTLEIDTGWVAAAGEDPVALLHRYAGRISMIHVKDFAAFRPSTLHDPERAEELGRGVLPLRRIFEAARECKLRHYFIEQESFRLPPLKSLQIDYDYVHGLHA